MKTKHSRIIDLMRAALLCICGAGLTSPSFGQETLTIDFDNTAPYRDFSQYSEDGFTLTTNVGQVRINNAFKPFSNAAQPSFGFGQGMDSSFTFRHSQETFNLLSIDLLEATGVPEKFGVTLIGTRSDGSTVTRTLTLDGIAGAQTFTLPSTFSGLTSLRIAEDSANSIRTEAVQIDNIRATAPGSLQQPEKSALAGQYSGTLRHTVGVPSANTSATIISKVTGRITDDGTAFFFRPDGTIIAAQFNPDGTVQTKVGESLPVTTGTISVSGRTVRFTVSADSSVSNEITTFERRDTCEFMLVRVSNGSGEMRTRERSKVLRR